MILIQARQSCHRIPATKIGTAHRGRSGSAQAWRLPPAIIARHRSTQPRQSGSAGHHFGLVTGSVAGNDYQPGYPASWVQSGNHHRPSIQATAFCRFCRFCRQGVARVLFGIDPSPAALPPNTSNQYRHRPPWPLWVSSGLMIATGQHCPASITEAQPGSQGQQATTSA